MKKEENKEGREGVRGGGRRTETKKARRKVENNERNKRKFEDCQEFKVSLGYKVKIFLIFIRAAFVA